MSLGVPVPNGGRSAGAPSSHPRPLDGTSHTTQLHVTPGSWLLMSVLV